MAPNAKFLADVTIPDNTAILAGTSFTKSWMVQNNGDVAWTPGFELVYSNDVNLAAINSMPLPHLAPGEQTQISIAMTAPQKPGKYTCNWIFRDSQGNVFGDHIYVIIAVQAVTTPVGQNRDFFVADVTIPDNTQIQPGASFQKTWRIRNIGTQAWNSQYTLALTDGNIPSQQTSIGVPAVGPNSEVDLSVNFTAPQQPGTYTSNWKMKDDKGQLFGIKLWVTIAVPGQVVVPPAPPLPTVQAHAPHYSQRDPRWANTPLANNANYPSIARWGCMLTSFSMLASSMGHVVTPAQLNTMMAQGGGFASGDLTRWDALHIVFPDIQYDGLFHGQDAISRIDASLAAGRAVPVQVDLSPATSYSDSDQHWVLALGRNGQDYWINDPIDYTDSAGGPIISLMKRYGRSNGLLADSVLSAILYHK